jgi:hypothetical protein
MFNKLFIFVVMAIMAAAVLPVAAQDPTPDVKPEPLTCLSLTQWATMFDSQGLLFSVDGYNSMMFVQSADKRFIEAAVRFSLDDDHNYCLRPEPMFEVVSALSRASVLNISSEKAQYFKAGENNIPLDEPFETDEGVWRFRKVGEGFTLEFQASEGWRSPTAAEASRFVYPHLVNGNVTFNLK